MLVIGLFAVGLGWIAAGLHVFLRDTAQLVSVLLQLWFWVTPIMIDPDIYPVKLRFLLFANPLFIWSALTGRCCSIRPFPTCATWRFQSPSASRHSFWAVCFSAM